MASEKPLKNTFRKGVEITFNAFSDAVQTSTYQSIVNTGYDSDRDPVKYPVRLIADSFSTDDVENLSFSDKIQATDVKGLVPGVDLDDLEKINTADKIVTEWDGTFLVIAYDIDPMKALYTFLLRKA